MWFTGGRYSPGREETNVLGYFRVKRQTEDTDLV